MTSVTKQLHINSTCKVRHNTTTSTKPQHCSTQLAMPYLHNPHMISHHAVNNLILDKLHLDLPHFTPLKRVCPAASRLINLAHYAMLMSHPVTRANISSYHKLMKDPATAEIWMTVFGKDFGGTTKWVKKGQMPCLSCPLPTYL